MWIPYPAVKCLYACTCVKSWKQCNNFLVDRQVHYLLRASIMLSQGGSNLQKLLLFSKKKLLRHTRCRKVVNKFDPASTGIQNGGIQKIIAFSCRIIIIVIRDKTDWMMSQLGHPARTYKRYTYECKYLLCDFCILLYVGLTTILQRNNSCTQINKLQLPPSSSSSQQAFTHRRMPNFNFPQHNCYQWPRIIQSGR